MEFESVEHFGILLALVATTFGLFRGIRAWRAERAQALQARVRHEQQLEEVLAEFRPRNGRTLAEVVAAIDLSVADHHAKADRWFAQNEEDHKVLHRRIDGLFEMLGGTNGKRRQADRHHEVREEDRGE